MHDSQGKNLRWPLIRDLLIFQLKLAADALRDLLLSPLSIFAAILDLLATEDANNSMFYSLMRLGRRTDRWINLFGARSPDRSAKSGDKLSMDLWINQLESVLKDQYQRGGMTSNTKDAIDKTLDNCRDQFKQATLKLTTSQKPNQDGGTSPSSKE